MSIRTIRALGLCLLGGLAFLSASGSPARAAVGIYHTVNYQGKISNADSTNVTNGTYSFVFSIYSVSSGGSAVWTETQSLTVTDGIFQANLGAVTALPGSLDFNSDSLYLGINFNSDGEMTPRVRFTAVPQAFNSEKVGGLSVTGPSGGSLSFAGNFSTAGTGALTLTTTAATSVTLPTSGTLATLANAETLTNKTIGSGSAYQGAAVGVAYGGTGLTTLTSNGLLVGNGTSAVSVLAAGSNGQCLVVAAGAPSYGSCTTSGGSSFYIQNGTSLQGSANFNISGSGTLGGSLAVASAVGIGTLSPSQSLEISNGNLQFDTVPAPASAPTGSVSGSGVLTGSYTYTVAYVTASGGTTEVGPVSSAVTASANKISVSVPVSPSTAVTGRTLYRSQAGGNTYTLVASIGDNTSTTYLDNASDGSIASNSLSPASNLTGGLTYVNSGGSVAEYVGPNNTFFGLGSRSRLQGSATANTGIGNSALNSVTSGRLNVAVGGVALLADTTGYDNTAVGYSAMVSLYTGHDNVAVGAAAAQNDDTGSYNVALGTSAMIANVSGIHNVSVGDSALQNDSAGDANVAVGGSSLAQTLTAGSVGLGFAAGYANISGSRNSYLGYFSGNSDGTVSTPSNLSNSTAIGAYAQVTASNSLILGGTGSNAVNVGIGTTAPAGKLDVIGTQASAANYGLVNIGSGGFAGSTGNFIGSSSGTQLAVNAGSGFAGSLADLQVNGVSKLKIDASGNLSAVGNVVVAGTVQSGTLTSSGVLALTSSANGTITIAPNGSGNVNVALGTGKLTAGDGGTTNYSQFDQNGALTYHGSARPYAELGLLPQTAVTPASGGCTVNATDDAGSGTSYKTLDCSAAVDSYGSWQFKMPQNYSSSSPVQVDVYWMDTASASTSAARFDVGYTSVPAGSTFAGATRTDVAGSSVASAGQNKENDSPLTLSSPSISAGDLVVVRVKRVGSADTLPDTAKVLQVRVRYLVTG